MEKVRFTDNADDLLIPDNRDVVDFIRIKNFFNDRKFIFWIDGY
jgi:hypothetical protein